MDNELQTAATKPGRKRWPLRRGSRVNRVVAGISWAGVLFVLVTLAWSWHLGVITPASLVTFAFAGIGCALGGVLALSGDGDVILFTGADEGQREAMRDAAMAAFSLAFWGMALLWMGYCFWPAWRAAAYLHIGILLVLVTIVYLGGYLWRRRHL